ncbi:MAG: hypothetical protein U0075_07810 [Thermomicrobiales bacterium]
MGVWAEKYAQDNFEGTANALDDGLPALTTTVARSTGFADGLKSVLPDAKIVASVDGQGVEGQGRRGGRRRVDRESGYQHVFGINDDSALGGLRPSNRRAATRQICLSLASAARAMPARTRWPRVDPTRSAPAAMFPEYQDAS